MITPQQAIELIIEHGLAVSLNKHELIIEIYKGTILRKNSYMWRCPQPVWRKEITIKDYCEAVEKAVTYFEKQDKEGK